MSAPTTRGGKGRPARTSKHWPDEATFLRERDVFVLRQLMLDFSLPHHAAQIGGLIALHVNFECGVAEVGYPALMAQTNLSKDTISRAVRAMDQAGHLAVEYGRGRNRTNKIAWVIKPDTRSGGFLGMAKELIVPSRGRVRNPASQRGFPDQENPAGERGFTDETPATRREKPRKLAEKTPLVCGPNTQKNTQLNTQGAEARSRAPQAPPQDEVGSSGEDDFQLLEDDGDSRALCAAMTFTEADHPEDPDVAPGPASDPDPAAAPKDKDGAGRASAVTEADLDAREAEERAALVAAEVEAAPIEEVELADALATAFGFDLDDPDQLAADLLSGFPADVGDDDAARRAADTLAAAFAGFDRGRALPVWEAVKAALARTVSRLAVSPERGELAVIDLNREAAAASARRKASHTEESKSDPKAEEAVNV